MNSREAIQKIKDFKVIFSEGVIYPFEDYYKEEIATIEKDLEVLEHLKLLFNGYKLLEKIGIKYEDMYLLCKNGDDYLIKEWLKNGN